MAANTGEFPRDSTDYVLADDGNRNNTAAEPDYTFGDSFEELRSSDTMTLRGYCGHVVTNPLFKKTIIVLIILNSIQMGVGTYKIVREDPTVDAAFEIMDHGFLILFTVELVMHFAHYGIYGLFQDGWLTFDFWVIFLSWSFSSFAIIRAFRIVRAVRLITKIRELRDLILALIGVIPKMFAIGVLMTLVFYIFGVMFTQLFHSAYEDGLTEVDYFSSLHRSFFSLFQLMTLENWSYITRDLMVEYPFAWLPMIVFILVSSFIVINLVIAVICDAVANLQRETKDDQIESESLPDQQRAGQTAEIERLEAKVDQLTEMVRELLRNQCTQPTTSSPSES